MRRTAIFVLSFFFMLAIFTSCARTARVESEATAGEALTKLIPRSTASLIVLNFRRLLAIDPIVKAMQEPQFKERYDEFVKKSGIDPKKDVAYMAVRGLAIEEASRMFMQPRGASIQNMALVFNLKYQRARLQRYIKETAPEAKTERYNGVTIYSVLNDKAKRPVPAALAGMKDLSFEVALLDNSHIVIGNGPGIRGIIDVTKKKAEPLAKSLEMTALLRRVDASGIAWLAVAYPPELTKKMAESNPMFKGLEGIKGMTVAFDDKSSTFVADLRILGGSKEQNAAQAANFNGLKAMVAAMYGTQEPALGEMLQGIAISSGDDFTRLTLTVSHETLGKVWQLAQPKTGDLAKPKKDGQRPN